MQEGYDNNHQFRETLPTRHSARHDFGFANPFVCLWIQVDENGLVRVVDEYVRYLCNIFFCATSYVFPCFEVITYC